MSPNHDSATHPIDALTSGLLAKLSAGWSPLPPRLPLLTEVTLNGEDQTRSVLGVREVAGEAEVRFRAVHVPWDPDTVSGALRGTTVDGAVFEGRVSNTSVSFGDGTPGGFETVLRCRRWSLLPADPVTLWVARVEGGPLFDGVGNLEIRRRRGGRTSWSSENLRLHPPGGPLYLVTGRVGAGEKGVWVALARDAMASGDRELWRDLMLLRTVLGKPIRTGLFFGLSDDGAVVGARSESLDPASRDVTSGVGPMAPLPPSRDGGVGVWAVPFYRRLTERYDVDSPDDPVKTAVYRYAHTLTPAPVEVHFASVAGSILTLLSALVEDDGGTSAGWSADVQDAVEEVQAALADGGHAEISEAVSALRDLWGRTERRFLTDLDPEAGPVVFRELAEARIVWERGVWTGSSDQPLRDRLIEGFQRVARLRWAFAVLLARVIGYGGPVSRPVPLVDAVDREGWLPTPSASEADAEEASARYLAEVEGAISAVWPGFEAPSLPESPLVQRLVAFADGLRERTGGTVAARLRPLPRREGDPVTLSFRLYLVNDPSVHVALFSLEVTGEALVVRGWGDEPVVVEDDSGLGRFVADVAGSEEIRYQVDRLVLIDDDLRRGEAGGG